MLPNQRKRQSDQPALIVLSLCLISVATAGCQTVSKVVSRTRPEIEFKTMEMVYAVDSVDAGISKEAAEVVQTHFSNEAPNEAVSGEDAQQTDEDTSNDLVTSCGEWSAAKIRIIYPHPKKGTQYAQAVLRVSRCPPGAKGDLRSTRQPSSKSWMASIPFIGGKVKDPEIIQKTPWNSGMQDEVWSCDLDRGEVEILVQDLQQNGFFEKQKRPRGEAELTVDVDQSKTSKPWTSVPRIEHLIQHVYREGQLVGFVTQTDPTSDSDDPHWVF